CGGSKHGHAADMTEFEGTLDVGCIKQALEGGSLRLKLMNDVDDAVVDGFQAVRYRVGWFGTNGAAADKNTIGAIAVDDAVTGDSGSAIDAQNPHRSKKQLRRVRIPRYRNSRRRVERRRVLQGLPSTSRVAGPSCLRLSRNSEESSRFRPSE